MRYYRISGEYISGTLFVITINHDEYLKLHNDKTVLWYDILDNWEED